MLAAGLILAVAGVAAILFLCIQRPVTSTKTKKTSTAASPRTSAVKKGRGVKLIQVSPSVEGPEDTHGTPVTDTGIDIIAIHGLDTNSPRTWEFKKEDGQRVNWLADKHMLPAEVPGTRIFTCDWPAEGLETKDSVSLRIEELALSLLQGILGSNLERKRPILFVASCLGGIILMQALVEAKDEYACIREATRGVIFLATPFRGTALQDSAIWAQPALRIKALVLGKKVSKLLGWLNEPTFDLTRLVGQFTRLCKGRDHECFDVFTFYETGTTYLPAQVPLFSFLLPGSKQPLVDMSSATLDCVPNPLPLHRNHSRMNKFCGPLDSDPDYKSVVEVMKRFIGVIQTGTLLEQADSWIRERHYDKERLKIERLSGDALEMSQCYINLALVEIEKVGNSKSMSGGSSAFSLTSRLELETPDDDLRVELPNLFHPREVPDGNIEIPRRILIRGRAGVGKTTLCKKIVYDFIHAGMWKDLFKRVIWIRLRELKSLPNDNYSLDKVLGNIIFRQHSQHSFHSDQFCNKLCTDLCRHIEDTQSRDTLFLLDGLDEVPELTMDYRHGNPHPGQELLKGLLNRPNIIITTRPHATFPTDFRQPDLELGTMGFSIDQVLAYIEAVMPEDEETIVTYLYKHEIMQSLVQIPIQLDALCFTWQASSIWNTVIPETMTAVYEAMVKELWRKDNERLEKDGIQIIGIASPAETDPFDSTQYKNLGYLAFSGLCSNVIEFQPHHRNSLYRFMKKGRTNLSFDETFARLSFWRTSDPSNSLPNQSYHFIHLTFQEYFSAKHFAKAWRCKQDLEYIEFDGERLKKQLVSCRKFLGRHKFTPRYNIMWRFVAGLLDEDEAQTSRFLEAIECEPVDVLGPTQQRLVMHCLAEVTQSADLRARLEEQLSQWLEFELNFCKTSGFVFETEFPERAMNLALERTSEANKDVILYSFERSLETGRFLPLTTVEFITSCLERRVLSQPLQLAALIALEDRSLPTRTLDTVISLMDDNDKDMRDKSVSILQSHAPWPDHILRAVMSRFGSQDSDTDSGIKERTARALRIHSTISGGLLRRITSWINDQVPSITREVLQTLGRQHKLDEDIIRIMAALLDDQQRGVRVLVFEILQRRKELPLDILDSMAIYLEADNTVKGVSTHMNLKNKLSDKMLRAVKRRLEGQDTKVQQRALKVVCREHKKRPEMPFDDVLDILVRWLEGGDNKFIHFALSLLDGESELPERVTKVVMKQLRNHDKHIPYLAFEVLLIQNIRCADVIRKTIEWLQFGDQEQKTEMLWCLSRKSSLPLGVLKAIVEQLDNEDIMILGTILDRFSELGSREAFPNDILSAITERIFHPDEDIRWAAAKALTDIWNRQGSPLELLKGIMAGLKNHDKGIRKAALEALAVLGDQHSFLDWTLDAIAVHLADPDQEIKYTAAKTLQGIAHRQVFPDYSLSAIAALLGDIDKNVRCKALDILAILGRRQIFPPDTLRIMADQLRGYPWMKGGRFVFEALADQSCLLENTLQDMLVLGVKGSDPGFRHAALCLIRQLPKIPEEICGLLVVLLDDRSSGIRQLAVEALTSHGGLSDNTYHAIAQLLESGRDPESQKLVELLGTCPTPSVEILQAVARRVSDRNGLVQQAVVKVLKAQKKLPDTILKFTASYSAWLRRSFYEDVYCLIEDGVTYLELPAGSGKIRLWGEPNELREAIRKIQMELGMPVRSTKINRR